MARNNTHYNWILNYIEDPNRNPPTPSDIIRDARRDNLDIRRDLLKMLHDGPLKLLTDGTIAYPSRRRDPLTIKRIEALCALGKIDLDKDEQYKLTLTFQKRVDDNYDKAHYRYEGIGHTFNGAVHNLFTNVAGDGHVLPVRKIAE